MELESNFLEMRPKNTFFYNGFKELCEYLKIHNVKTILEIGGYVGESLSMFKKYIGQDVLIITIDPFLNMEDENDILKNQNFKIVEEEFNNKTLNLSNYGKIKLTSNEAFNLFKENIFDVVYIDGLHTYMQVKNDILNFSPLLKIGGFICGHDYVIKHTQEQEDFFYNYEGVKNLRLEVKKAVDETIGQPEKVFEDSSWLKQKTF